MVGLGDGTLELRSQAYTRWGREKENQDLNIMITSMETDSGTESLDTSTTQTDVQEAV